MIPDREQVAAARCSYPGARRVLLVDDHAPTLDAVGALLDREYPVIEVVGAARDGESALRCFRDTAPNIVVLDMHLGNEHGLDLLPAFTSHPGVAVIVLSASDDPMAPTRALAAGAAAFVSKLAPATELIAAVLAARPHQVDT